MNVEAEKKRPDTYTSEIKTNLHQHVYTMEPPPVLGDYSSLRNGLSFEARKWRVFTKQADALNCAGNLASLGVMAFTYHHSNCARRYFLATHPLELWHRNRNRPSNYNYEIIAEGQFSKLYLDLEFDRTINPNNNGVAMTETFNKVMIHVIGKQFNLSLDRTHVLDLDSTTDTKFSRHLIYQFPFPLAFKSNIEVGYLVIMACDLVREALKCNDSDSSRIVSDLKINRQDLEDLMVLNSSGNRGIFVDEGVYTRNRHFRLYGSTKFGRGAPLVLSPENQFTVPVVLESLKQEYLFLASLITYFTRVGTVIPIMDSKGRLKLPERLPPTINCKSMVTPFKQLDKFMLDTMSPCTLDVILRYQNDTIFVYASKQAGNCANIGRSHQRNRVFYVVLLKQGVFFQKCHDPDCRGFKSKSVCLPKHIQQEIGLEGDEWDDIIVKCMDDLAVTSRPIKKVKTELNNATS